MHVCPQDSVSVVKCCMRIWMAVCCWLALAGGAKAQQKPWPVKVVLVTTFEIGEDTGDRPGEFQFWVERNHLDLKLDFPGGLRPLRTNADHSIVGIVSGTALNNAAHVRDGAGAGSQVRLYPCVLAGERDCGGGPGGCVDGFGGVGAVCDWGYQPVYRPAGGAGGLALSGIFPSGRNGRTRRRRTAWCATGPTPTR